MRKYIYHPHYPCNGSNFFDSLTLDEHFRAGNMTESTTKRPTYLVLDAILAAHQQGICATISAIAEATALAPRSISALIYALEKQHRVVAADYLPVRSQQQFSVIQYERNTCKGRSSSRVHPAHLQTLRQTPVEKQNAEAFHHLHLAFFQPITTSEDSAATVPTKPRLGRCTKNLRTTVACIRTHKVGNISGTPPVATFDHAHAGQLIQVRESSLPLPAQAQSYVPRSEGLLKNARDLMRSYQAPG